jgi:hypothetical protein
LEATILHFSFTNECIFWQVPLRQLATVVEPSRFHHRLSECQRQPYNIILRVYNAPEAFSQQCRLGRPLSQRSPVDSLVQLAWAVNDDYGSSTIVSLLLESFSSHGGD